MSLDSVEDITDVWDRVAADEAAALALYPVLRRFAAVVAPAEIAPDDLVQEALVATLRRHSLASLDDPAAYIRRVMLNLAANHRRRFARTRRALTRWRGDANDSAVDVYPSDLADLAALRPVERAVLFLHHVEAMPFDTISDCLALPASTVRQIATRARRQLRAHLEEDQ